MNIPKPNLSLTSPDVKPPHYPSTTDKKDYNFSSLYFQDYNPNTPRFIQASFPVPKDLRIGQTLFCFFEWCQQKNYLYKNQAGDRLGDFFDISDEKFYRYYLEFISEKFLTLPIN